MSIENFLSKAELSKQAEEYINQRLKGKIHDPSSSGCVVQVYSGKPSPFQIADIGHHVDVSDPSVIISKLKEVKTNVNWNTMKGALIRLLKWRFTSNYDNVNDKLRFEVIVEDAECIEGDGLSNQNITTNITPLIENSALKNKLNRLKKFHMAEEFNILHPIDTALEIIDNERQNASEVAKLVDPTSRRVPITSESLESNKENPFFWNYDVAEGSQAPITEPGFEEQNKVLASLANKAHQRSQENNNFFTFGSQSGMYQDSEGNIEEEEYQDKDYFPQNEDVSGKKSVERGRMEIEREAEEIKEQQQPRVRFQDVLNQKQAPTSSVSKKSNVTIERNSYAEQQKFIERRDGRKPGPIRETPEFDTLDLLNNSQALREKERLAIVEERLGDSSRKTGKSLIEKVLSRTPAKDEEIVVEITKKSPYKEITIRKTVQGVLGNPKPRKMQEDELLEISNNDYLSSFKLIKNLPLKKEEKESKQAKFVTKDLELEWKKKTPRREKPALVEDIEEEYSGKPKRVKTGKTHYVENPLNKNLKIDLSEFKTVNWKPATSSMNLFIRK